MIRFNCPSCGQGFMVKDEQAGRRGKCTKCHGEIIVPRPAAVEVAAAVAPPVIPSPPPMPPAHEEQDQADEQAQDQSTDDHQADENADQHDEVSAEHAAESHDVSPEADHDDADASAEDHTAGKPHGHADEDTWPNDDDVPHAAGATTDSEEHATQDALPADEDEPVKAPPPMPAPEVVEPLPAAAPVKAPKAPKPPKAPKAPSGAPTYAIVSITALVAILLGLIVIGFGGYFIAIEITNTPPALNGARNPMMENILPALNSGVLTVAAGAILSILGVLLSMLREMALAKNADKAE